MVYINGTLDNEIPVPRSCGQTLLVKLKVSPPSGSLLKRETEKELKLSKYKKCPAQEMRGLNWLFFNDILCYINVS